MELKLHTSGCPDIDIAEQENAKGLSELVPESVSNDDLIQKTYNSQNTETVVGLRNLNTFSSKMHPPTNWVPRRKSESFLQRKIRTLQEKEGMNSTLDETLSDSNKHVPRIVREKIAVQTTVQAVIEARKTALIEASWCKILKEASIQSESAELQLMSAQQKQHEAFEAASAAGVVMLARPRRSMQSLEIRTSFSQGNSTHTVSASFDTALEVDNEVVEAVKLAFLRLAELPSSSIKQIIDDHHAAFKGFNINKENNCVVPNNTTTSNLPSDLSMPSDDIGNNQQNESLLSRKVEGCSRLSWNRLSNSVKRCNKQSPEPAIREEIIIGNNKQNESLLSRKVEGCSRLSWNRLSNSLKRCNKQSPEPAIREEIISLMFSRLKRLEEDELLSLAMIVATTGLNVMLKEANINKGNSDKCCSAGLGYDPDSARSASPAANLSVLNEKNKVEEARKQGKSIRSENRIYKEETLLQFKETLKPEAPATGSLSICGEKENSSMNSEPEEYQQSHEQSSLTSQIKNALRLEEAQLEPGLSSIEAAHREMQESPATIREEGLDSANNTPECVFKSALEIEKDIPAAPETGSSRSKSYGNGEQSLDKILVKKHISALEKWKVEATSADRRGHKQRTEGSQERRKSIQHLEEILTGRHVPRLQKDLQREKEDEEAWSTINDGSGVLQRRNRKREEEIRKIWGGMSLECSMRKRHVSRLELDQAAWQIAEQQARQQQQQEFQAQPPDLI